MPSSTLPQATEAPLGLRALGLGSGGVDIGTSTGVYMGSI